MASDPAKYDSALLAILQNEGKVAPFLDVVLGFLYRRTDFFRIMKLETDRLGFPPGVAYKLLKNIFKKYETLAERDTQRIDEMRKAKEKEGELKEKQQREPTQQSDVEKPTSSAASNSTDSVAVATTSEESTLDGRGLEQPAVRTSEGAAVENEREVRMETDNMESSGNADDNTSKESAAVEDEEKEDPEQERKRRELQANPLTYNGAEMEAYYWSQTITETDVRVKVPKSIIKGKQLKVDIRKNHISVSKQEADGSWTELVNKELSWEINTEESMWTLSPGEFVHINLEKKQERWWENVFVDEPKINTRKIDCSRPMTDLDDEAQAKIEEMMFNQRQKQLGLPQSHEQKTHDMLRKAWDAEGSPFKGQPFDPSRFTVDPSGVVNFGDSSS